MRPSCRMTCCHWHLLQNSFFFGGIGKFPGEMSSSAHLTSSFEFFGGGVSTSSSLTSSFRFFSGGVSTSSALTSSFDFLGGGVSTSSSLAKSVSNNVSVRVKHSERDAGPKINSDRLRAMIQKLKFSEANLRVRNWNKNKHVDKYTSDWIEIESKQWRWNSIANWNVHKHKIVDINVPWQCKVIKKNKLQAIWLKCASS